MKTCYIVGAGDFSGCPEPNEDDFVIAADGGYEALIRHVVRCDLLIGDFDSLSELPPAAQLETVKYPVEKDDTDTFLAYKLGVERGYTRFRIYGGTGGRGDHTFANICLLHHAALAGHEATLHSDGWVYRVIKDGTITLFGNPGEHLSVFAVGGEAQGVSIAGAKYEAKDITLTPDYPLGVSNSFTDTECKISVRDGALLLMYQV